MTIPPATPLNITLDSLKQQAYTMSNFILAVLFCTCLLHSIVADTNDTSIKDGPCPSPAPAPHFNVSKISGRWLLTHMTFDAPPDMTVGTGPPACVEEQLELLDDGAFTINSTFKRDGDSQIKKYVPVDNVPGKYDTYTPTSSGWSDDVFHHSTFVAIDGDAFLDFCCRDLGNNQHREFHRIRSRNSPVPQEVLDKFLQIIRKSGDEQALYAYDQENCNYDE